MLRILIKKQLFEVFKGYFYNQKKNKMRSKAGIVVFFIFFLLIMVGVLGGMFTVLALSLCGGMVKAGMGWLYFLILSGLAIVFGAFGSVFNTYSGLYLSKDNDLLLSMPIPVRTIIASRLANVYLLGTMYSATVLLPTLIVYWVKAGLTLPRVICGILLFVIVTAFVLILSCLLGWVVAKLSLKLKNKSYITVIISLAFIGLYYFVYFKANTLIRDIIMNAAVYGRKVKGASYALYLFGRIGEGSWPAALIYTAVTAVLFAVVWTALSRSFISIATASGAAARVKYVEKRARKRSAFGAFFGKELARFTSSANYMLNCGLGILMVPACGVLFLIKGREITGVINGVFDTRPDAGGVLLAMAFCLMSSMNDIAAPSVSLEGKSIWIPQSLPVEAKTVLRAKAAVQLLLTAVPMLIATVLAAVSVEASPAVRVFLVVLPMVYVVFSAFLGMFIGLKMPLLNWTNETTPIKQGGAVTITLFGGWGICFVLGLVYFLAGYRMGAVPYLALCTALLAAVSLLLMRWLDTRGARKFAGL